MKLNEILRISRLLRSEEPEQPVRSKRTSTAKRGKRTTIEVAPAPQPIPKDGIVGESCAVLLIILGVFLGASLYSFLSQGANLRDDFLLGEQSQKGPPNLMGPLGLRVAEVLYYLLGWCSLVTVPWALMLGWTVWTQADRKGERTILTLFGGLLGSLTMAVSSATLAASIVGYDGGGTIGSMLAVYLISYVNVPGTILISFGVLMLSLGLATGIRAFTLIMGAAWCVRVLQGFAVDTWYFLVRLIPSWGLGKKVVGVFALLSTVYLFRWFRDLLLFPFKLMRAPWRKSKFRDLEVLAPTELDAMDRDDDEDSGFFIQRKKSLPEPVSVSEESRNSPALRISRRQRVRTKASKRLLSRNSSRKKSSSQRKREFKLPPLDFLVGGDTSYSAGPRDDELISNSRRLERALSDFRVSGRIVEVHPGPVITLYQFEPASGVKVQRIINLADDLALALKVGSVRVYAPVPGKGTVGIEVPNADREIVRLRDILDSKEFRESESKITIAVGKDTFGDPYVTDLARMPHLLIAGSTGSGKSVCINSVLLSFLYRNTPEDLRLIMIDPKMLELSVYEGIPHLKAPVVTDPKRARGVFWWAVQEMERRYSLMKALGVRNLASYNRAVSETGEVSSRAGKVESSAEGVIKLQEKDIVATGTSVRGVASDSADINNNYLSSKKAVNSAHAPLPRIVLVVDELADLMLTVGREIEELLTRLAQKARAAGIHLILATQRPSVNVITGLIKANFPARMSFRVASKIDARTVLDTSGSEKLLGQGDMLLLEPAGVATKRLHSAFVSDKEVVDVVGWVKQQRDPDYDPDIEEAMKLLDAQEQKGFGFEDTEEFDPLYDSAVALVVEKGQASTSMIQRAFRIGYNRAARILESMEGEGVVGPADGSRPRQVLVPNREIV